MTEPISHLAKGPDLSTCDQEPIHIPGQIQPFGVLLAGAPDLSRIAYGSANMADLIGAEPLAVLGQPFAAHLPGALLAQLTAARDTITATTQRERLGLFDLPVGPAEAYFHLNPDGLLILELEPASGDNRTSPVHIDEMRRLLTAVSAQDSLQAMLETTVDGLQELIGYDRVMAYRYASNGDGEVIAEAKTPGVDSFLGLRFPAWDVPKQARALQIKSPLRILSDVHQAPIPLLAAGPDDPPLDLGLAHLRGISAIHVEYLANMGVGASLVLGLIVDGALWGMLSCHHRSKRLISSDLRIAAELFAQMLSLVIKQRQEVEKSDRRSRAALARERMGYATETKTDLVKSFDEIAPILMDVIDCDGLAVTYEAEVLLHQSTPSRAAVEILARHQPDKGDLILALSGLAESGLLQGHDLQHSAGALIIRATAAFPLQLLIFRDEIARTLRWAGKPEKELEAGPLGPRITPRGSFDTYIESVRGTCEEWSEADMSAARELQVMLSQIATKSDRAAVQRHQELVVHHRQQELMIGELNHRVRNILALIRSVSRQAKTTSVSLESYALSLERRIAALAAAHDLAVTNEMEGVSLADLLAAETRPYTAPDGPRIQIDGAPVGLRTDIAPMLALVLHEIVTNAAKYGALSTPSGLVTTSWTLTDGWLNFRWQESGGPTVVAPTRKGFGSNLVERAIPFEMDGEVSLEFPQEGAVFTFRLQEKFLAELEKVEQQTVLGGVAEFKKAGSGATALLVEDNVMLAMDMVDSLSRLGTHNVLTASTLEKGLVIANRDDFDYAVLDLNLRGEASFEIAEALMARGKPFIFVTGYGSAIERPPQMQKVPILTKPVEDALLSDTIRKLLA